MAKQLIFILWPSFIVAAIAEGVFFTLFDPMELHFFGVPIEASRTAVYSLGFFAFWAFAAASSALTCFFQRTSNEVNPPMVRHD
jgi:membrane associated rhomboid family serine protease